MALQDITREFRNLERYDFRVLQGVESAMRFFDWVPVDSLPYYARMPLEEVSYRIGRLSKHKLVQRKTAHYVGYKLTFAGYDVLGINTLVQRNVIKSFGSKVGVGKESDIYDAERENGQIVIMKFHREGTTFRNVKRSRGYFGKTERCSWMLTSRLAAQSEFDALTSLYGSVIVPKPIAHNRHVIVMSLLNGCELGSSTLENPAIVLENIIVQVKSAYGCGVVHADLSEYNLIVDATEKVALIDWPQWVPTSHPNAEELLYRDITNVLSYFARKYHIKKRTEDVVAYVKQRDKGTTNHPEG
ncbi:MAG: serine/threonine-protein kinase RIO2 [Halobacteriota archaeon]